jgi:hypothetical protein
MAALSVGALFSAAQAQTGTSAFPGVDPVAIEDLVLANRILANEKVLDGFGHVSIRDPRNPNRYLMSRSVAPATVTADDIMEYDLDSKPVDAKGAAPTRSASSTARSTRCGRTSTPSSTVTPRPSCPSPSPNIG